MFGPSKGKAQSTVEYIILVTAVIMVALAYLGTRNSPFQVKLTNTMGTLSDQMTSAASHMVNAN